MPKWYRLRQTTEFVDTYEVEAESAEEAKRIWLKGSNGYCGPHVYLIDTYWDKTKIEVEDR